MKRLYYMIIIIVLFMLAVSCDGLTDNSNKRSRFFDGTNTTETTDMKPIEGDHVVNNKTVEITKDDVVIAGKSVKKVLQSVDANGVWKKNITKTGEVQFIFTPSKNIPASSTGFPKKALVAGKEYPIVITNDKDTGVSITGSDIVGDELDTTVKPIEGKHVVNNKTVEVTKDDVVVAGQSVKKVLQSVDANGVWKKNITKTGEVQFIFTPSKNIPASSTGFPKKALVAGKEYPIVITNDKDTGVSITGSDIVGDELDITVKPVEGKHVVNNKTVEVTKDDVVVAGQSVKKVLQSVDANGVWRKVLAKTREVQFIFTPSKNIPASRTGFPKKALRVGQGYPIVITNDKDTGVSITSSDIVGDELNSKKSGTDGSGGRKIVYVATPQSKSELQTLIAERIKRDGNNADLNDIDVRNITDMSYLFQKSSFNGDISQWDVSNVTNMQYMFFVSSFNGDLSQWDVSSVTNMKNMFMQSPFNQDISIWAVSSVMDMSSMFYEAQFNQDISDWDVSSVTNMNYMFYNAKAMTYNLEAWGTKLRAGVKKNTIWFNSGVSGRGNKPSWT